MCNVDHQLLSYVNTLSETHLSLLKATPYKPKFNLETHNIQGI